MPRWGRFNHDEPGSAARVAGGCFRRVADAVVAGSVASGVVSVLKLLIVSSPLPVVEQLLNQKANQQEPAAEAQAAQPPASSNPLNATTATQG